MSRTEEERFRKLLRWYPKAWREKNGEIFLGTLLDNAEQEGRYAPSSSEHRAAALCGFAARLDYRTALRASIAALVLSIFSIVFFFVAVTPVSTLAWSAWLLLILKAAIGVLSVAALVAVLRQLGLMSDVRALIMLALSEVALILNGFAVVSGSLSFDAASNDAPVTGLASAWIALLLATMILGAAALAMLIDAFLSKTTLKIPVRFILTGVAVIVVAPVSWLTTSTVFFSIEGFALAVTVLAVVSSRRVRRGSSIVVRQLPCADFVPEPRSSLVSHLTFVCALCLLAFLGSSVGLVYAFTGSSWSSVPLDGTNAMSLGITFILASSFPLLTAVGIIVFSCTQRLARQIWGPLALLACSFAVVAIVISFQGVPWDRIVVWCAVALVLQSAALSWWVIPRVQFSRATAVFLGVAVGVLYAVFLAVNVTALIIFGMPLAAVVCGICAFHYAQRGGAVSTRRTAAVVSPA
ncbi:MAG: hypothetical protein ACRCSP_06985 [Rhodoglobus sp.]